MSVRRGGLALGALALAGWLGWMLRPPAGSAPRPGPAVASVPAAVSGVSTAVPAALSERAPLARVFATRADDVRASCDLPLDVRCDDAACVGVLTAPDLDRIDGWVSLVFRSPRFVLSTAARDLGVPSRMLPCGSAVAALVGDHGVDAVELADGTEIWCTVTGAVDAGRALCDAVAAERGRADARFGAEGLRRLAF